LGVKRRRCFAGRLHVAVLHLGRIGCVGPLVLYCSSYNAGFFGPLKRMNLKNVALEEEEKKTSDAKKK
jgi:hypothetical protein